MLNRSKVSRKLFKSRQDMYGILLVGLSFLALSFLTVKTFAPDVSSSADTNTATAGSSSYSASISISDTTSISINPTDAQTIFTGQNNITYTNQCPHGFTVTLSSASEDPSLTRAGNDSATKTIPTISSGNILTDNTWGYSLDNGETYNGVPSISSPATIINTASANTDPVSLNLTYGVKINNGIPAGKYSNDVIYTVAVKPQCLVYGLKWNLNGGTGASGASYTDQTINYGNTINLQSYAPTRTGYTFAGWKSSATNNTFPASATTTDVNPTNAMEVTLTAQWAPVNYTIAYTLNGGSATNPTSYNIETNTITLNNPTRANYNFAGWTGSNGTTKQTTVTIPKGSTGNKSYTANWTPVNYTISYTLNGGSVSGNPTSYNIETATFALKNPTRYGYNFTGWTGSNGSTAQTSVSIAKGSTGNKSYTANWQATIKAISTMQSMTSAICSATAIGTSTTLTDTRDNNTYTVKKLKDGKCWMTQNLRIAGKTITSADSNVSSNFTIPVSDLSNFSYQQVYDGYDINAVYVDPTYGGYYKFITATAGWGEYAAMSGNSPRDICPKGWRLPTYGGTNEISNLITAYDNMSSDIVRDAGVIASGSVLYSDSGGTVSTGTDDATIWTSTTKGTTSAWRAYLYNISRTSSSGTLLYNTMDKQAGFSVRCVAK